MAISRPIYVVLFIKSPDPSLFVILSVSKESYWLMCKILRLRCAPLRMTVGGLCSAQDDSGVTFRSEQQCILLRMHVFHCE